MEVIEKYSSLCFYWIIKMITSFYRQSCAYNADVKEKKLNQNRLENIAP